MIPNPTPRRIFLKQSAAAALATLATSHLTAQTPNSRPLFDGLTLKGWTPKPRGNKSTSLGSWKVVDGVLIGGQYPVGAGCYLVSDEAFTNFELQLDARPDWPADTGIYLRAAADGHAGIQVNLDYRPHGSIGGYFGNGLGSFHAYSYGFTADKHPDGSIARLIPGPPSQPNDTGHLVTPDFMAPAETLLKVWKLNDWNTLRMRSIGDVPTITTWINNVRISELNTAKLVADGWSTDNFLKTCGHAGHIGLEVHNNAPGDWLGNDRWAPGAVCRWRNITIKTL